MRDMVVVVVMLTLILGGCHDKAVEEINNKKQKTSKFQSEPKLGRHAQDKNPRMLTIISLTETPNSPETYLVGLRIRNATDKPIRLLKDQFSVRCGRGPSTEYFTADSKFVSTAEAIIIPAEGEQSVALEVNVEAIVADIADPNLRPFLLTVFVNSPKQQREPDQWLGQASSNTVAYSDDTEPDPFAE